MALDAHWDLLHVASRIALSSGLAILLIFVREALVVRKFGATPIVDSFYLSLAPLTLVTSMVTNVCEVRLVPLLATEPRGRYPQLPAFALRFGYLLTGVWLCGGLLLMLTLGNTRFQSLGYMAVVEALAMIPSALFAANRSHLLAMGRLRVANLATAVGAGASVVTIIASPVVAVLPFAVGIGLLVQWLVTVPVVRIATAQSAPISLRLGGDVFRLSIAMLLGTSLTTIDRTIASFLGTGAVTAIAVADRIYQVPATVSVTSLSGAVFPQLVQATTPYRFARIARESLRLNLAITIPLAVAGALFAGDLMRAVAGNALLGGRLQEDATGTLSIFAVTVPFYSLSVLLTRLLLAFRRESVVRWQVTLSAAAKLVGGLVGAHLFGLPGIALATLALYVLSDALLIYFVIRLRVPGLGGAALAFGPRPVVTLAWQAIPVALAIVIFHLEPAGPMRLLIGSTLGAITMAAGLFGSSPRPREGDFGAPQGQP